MKRFLILFISATVLVFGGAATASTADKCAGLIPAELKSAIKKKYPGYRLPIQTNYSPDYIKYNIDKGGSGCLGIATGSYYANSARDYVIYLTSAAPTHTILVVAHQAATKWEIGLVWDLKDEKLGSLYVETLAPGKYERTEALDGPITGKDERETYLAKLQGFAAGTIESSGAAFFFDSDKWIHIWIED